MTAIISAALLASCGIGTDEQESESALTDEALVIGVVVPLSGEYSAYSQGTELLLEAATAEFEKNYDGVFTFIIEDSGSETAQAEEAAERLIKEEGADIMIAAHDETTVNAVSATCERLGVLCISADSDMDSWLSSGSYENSFHISYDWEGRLRALAELWSSLEDTSVVGVLLEEDMSSEILDIYDDISYDYGVTVIDPGSFREGMTDYSAIISTLQTTGCEIVTGIMDSADFAMLKQQAEDAGYSPSMWCVADSGYFENDVLSMGELASGIYTDVTWSSDMTYTGAVSGLTCAEIGALYEAEYSVSAPGSCGYIVAAMECALDIAGRAASQSPEDLRTAALTTSLETVVGSVSFNEDGSCLMSVSAGMWSYDAENQECTLALIE